MRLDDGSVLCLSEDRRSFLAFFSAMLVPVVLSILVIVAYAFPLSRLLARRIMDPINGIDPSSTDVDSAYCEMELLIVRVRDQQEQLRIQNERLSKRDDTRREFSANVSHEMKTPLQVISGYAELMRDGMVPAEHQREFAGKVYGEAQVMCRLVDDVLMSPNSTSLRWAASRWPWSMSPCPSSRLSNALRTRPRIGTSPSPTTGAAWSCRLMRDLSRAPCSAWWKTPCSTTAPADRFRCACSSAMAPIGRGTSRRARSTSRSQTPTKASSLEDQKHVFERFYRVEKSRSRETGGTGLGLAIVKHVAELHGDSVERESVPGVGSTFRLVIPNVPFESFDRDASLMDVG